MSNQKRVQSHKHRFDGPEVVVKTPHLGGPIMSVYTSKTCSVCGISESQYLQSIQIESATIA